MEPNEDSELRDLLREWPAPPTPASLAEHLFGMRRSWWRTSIRVPLPFACVLALLMVALAWRSADRLKPRPERIVVKTERVEVPLVRERIVRKIIYKNRSTTRIEHALTFKELKPVGELRLRILRPSNAQN